MTTLRTISNDVFHADRTDAGSLRNAGDPMTVQELSEAVDSTICRFCKGKDVGIAFSGGLDSGLVSALALRHARSVICYTCGTDNAFDVRAGRELAEELGISWVHCRISKSDIEARVRELISSVGESDPFTVSYELQLFCVCRTADQSTILTGQGSDEYLGGCAKYVGQTEEVYDAFRDAAIDRLNMVSIPCELRIAEHFGKELLYPYMDPEVLSVISSLDPDSLRPKDMDSRKSVLREVAAGFGFKTISERRKKSSQYGSGTTDLIRAVARDKGLRYNEYIASIYDEVCAPEIPFSGRGSIINARVDSVVKAEAERIIQESGSNPSEAISRLYKRIISDGDLRFLERRHRILRRDGARDEI